MPATEIESGVSAVGRIGDANELFHPVGQRILLCRPSLLDQLPELRLAFSAEDFLKLFREQP